MEKNEQPVPEHVAVAIGHNHQANAIERDPSLCPHFSDNGRADIVRALRLLAIVEGTPPGKTPRTDAISHRLQNETGLFCDKKSLEQYNDLVDLAVAMERELNAVQTRIRAAAHELEREIDGDSPAWDGPITTAIRTILGEWPR